MTQHDPLCRVSDGHVWSRLPLQFTGDEAVNHFLLLLGELPLEKGAIRLHVVSPSLGSQALATAWGHTDDKAVADIQGHLQRLHGLRLDEVSSVAKVNGIFLSKILILNMGLLCNMREKKGMREIEE